MQIFSVIATHPPNVFSLGHPSATTQAWEGSRWSLRFATALSLALQGGFCVTRFSHHRSARGPGARAASCPKRSFGNGLDPCQVQQLPRPCVVESSELVAKRERVPGAGHRADFIAFLLVPSLSARPSCPGLAVIQPAPSFLRAEPQVALASQGVG